MVSLADVLARPDDEEVRLAYSDAIAGTDVARAELIKLQIVLARWRREHVSPAGKLEAAAREQVLLETHAKRWAEPVKKLVDGVEFLRGFVEVVTLDAAKFLATYEQLYNTEPVLHVTFTNAGPVAEQLFACPGLARLKSIELWNNQLGDAGAIALAKSPYLGSLKWLGLGKNQIGTAGLEALAQHLADVGYVNFEANAIPDPTPGSGDEYASETPVGRELVGKFGPRAWLAVRYQQPWPPERDAVD